MPLIHDKQSARELADVIRWYGNLFQSAWCWVSGPFRRKEVEVEENEDPNGDVGGHSGR
jgi:hypothetical protein